MVKKKLLLCWQVCLAFVWLLSFSLHAQNFSNPVSDLADPFITYYGGNYYLTGTTGGNVALRRATTLDGLKRAPLTIIYTPGPGAPCCNYWAPEIHRINGRWYAYFTAGTSGDLGTQRTYVLEGGTGDPFSAPWTYRGQIADDQNIWAIDGTVLQLNGQSYFLWSSGDFGQSIAIARMTSPWTLAGHRVILSRPDFAYENDRALNEGPSVLQRNGRTFVTFSASGCETPNYALGLLTLNNPNDPLNPGSWSKSSEAVFRRNDVVATFGPGHNGFFTSPDGTEDWLVYHATANPGGGCDGSRTTRAQKVYWNVDGTPTFGVPVKPGKLLPAPSGETGLPSGAPIANGTYRLTPLSSTGSALDVTGCSSVLGTVMEQYQWYNNDCQKWNIQATGDGYYTISSYASGLVLELSGCSSADAAPVQQWAPNGGACQQWRIEDVGGGNFRIVNRTSGKVLDVQFGGTNNGALVQQYTWLNANNQKWRLDPVGQPRIDNGVYAIFSEVGGKVLDVTGCSNAPFAQVGQWQWLNNNCQRWSVEDVGGGAYRIVAQNSGLVLDIPGCSATPGTYVQLYNWLNNDCQKFYINPAGNGYYNVVSLASGLALDVYNCSWQNGARIDQWNLWNGPCQRWRFERVTTYAPRVATAEETALAEPTLTVFPNPASDYLRVKYTFEKAGKAKLELVSVLAKTAASQTESVEAGEQELTLNTQSVRAGIYILRLHADGRTISRSVMIGN